MLPTKQYFYISALVPASKLHPIMKLLGKSSAYNVECRAYDDVEQKQARPNTKRDMEAVKQKIIDLLKKNGTMAAADILDHVGEAHKSGFGLLNRMKDAKLIKRAAKKGMYRA